MRPMPNRLTLAAAAVLGVIVFERSLGFHVLNPSALAWMFHGGIDPSGHFLGWHLFRHDAWWWPPGAVMAFGHPIGTSVALTDSIPLVAIPLKLADGVLPPVFQFMGFWLLACFILQAVFGALLIATATSSPLLQLLGAAMFALSPVLLNRIGHQALCAHWLLLAALWLYARAVNTSTATSFGWWIALTAAVALTHPYLTVQVVAVAVAATVRTSRGGRPLRRAAMRLGALGVTVGASWWAAGYFVVRDAGSLQESGFGRLSLNLAAPLLPPPGAWMNGRVPLAGLAHEQLEGYSYLGLGGFVLIGVALPVGLALLGRGMSGTRRYVPLVVACVVLALLAIGPTVTFGTRVLFEYDGSWWGPLGIFRSSGRVFWIVYYAILFAGIAAIVRLPRGWAAGVLATVVVLQQIDLAGVQQLSKRMRDIRAESPLKHELWTILPPHYRHMVLYPTNMCSPNPGIDYRDLAVLAGSAGATINAGYAGRVNVAQLQAYCRDLEARMARGEVADDSLYVVTSANVPRLLASTTPVACTPLEPYTVCFTVASYARWREQSEPIRRSVAGSGELADSLDQLEAKYRDRLGR